MKRTKITVVGAGNVGATTAQRVVEKHLGDVVLVDKVSGLARGKALDLTEAGPIYGYDSQVIGSESFDETAGSDIIIITAGVPRKPGMSREELLTINAGIVQNVVDQTTALSPEAIVIVVTNPLDAMTYVVYKAGKRSKEKVMGMAGVLDTSRFRSFIAMELGVSVETVHALVLGGHGDAMVPLLRYTTVAGVPVTEMIPQARLDALVKRTREAGAQIVELLKMGSAYYAPSAAITEMVESIVLDKKKILPCAALCEGEFGVHGLFVGVPALLGRRGVEKIVEMTLTADEDVAFRRSVSIVDDLCRDVEKLMGKK